MRQFVGHRFPALKDAQLLKTHACHYELSSSRNFIVAPHPQITNLLIAGGGNLTLTVFDQSRLNGSERTGWEATGACQGSLPSQNTAAPCTR
jgi:hypothetical protein